MDIMSQMMSLQEICDTDLSFSERLQSMPTEEILNVWASSQALSLFLQDSLLPARPQVQSQTETHIIMELMRRDLARLENKQAHNAAAFAEPESFAPLRAAR